MQDQPRRLGIPIAIVDSGGLIYYVAVLLTGGHRKFALEGIGHRKINIQGCICPTIGANNQFHVAAEFIGRLLGDNIDCTADGISSEQGALWPPQYFNALNVEKLDRARYGTCVVDAVDIDADAGLCRAGKIELPDTADKHHDAVGLPG